MQREGSTTGQAEEHGTVATLRAAVLVLFVIGTVGVGAELLLIEHTESPWQIVPLVLMAVSLLVVVWTKTSGTPLSVRSLQVTMGFFVVSGILGLFLHYRGNAEFELEMYPSLRGLELFWEAMRGATPVLGPGAMIELGLLGLAHTYRHPIFRRARDPNN